MPNLGDIGPNLVEHGQVRPISGQVRPKLRPSFVEVGPGVVEFGPTLVAIGRALELGEILPESTEFGQMLAAGIDEVGANFRQQSAKFGRAAPKLRCIRPTSARNRQSGPNSANFDQSWPDVAYIWRGDP